MLSIYDIVFFCTFCPDGQFHENVNNTCLLPKEVQSLHWNQEPCAIYLVVVLRTVDSEIREDHFVIISGDAKHDVPFVKLANKKILEHCRGLGISFDIDTEFNDGCTSQYMSKTAVYHLVQREKLVSTLKHHIGKVSQMD